MKVLHNTKVKFTHTHRWLQRKSFWSFIWICDSFWQNPHQSSDTFLGSGSNTSVLFSDCSQDWMNQPGWCRCSLQVTPSSTLGIST